MSAVSVTAASVAPTSNTVLITGTLGGTVTAGQPVYLDSTTNTYKLADANASALTADVKGTAMTGGVSGQPVIVATGGTINPGFTVTPNVWYLVGATAGEICPAADVTSGWYGGFIGVGLTTSTMAIRPYLTGVTS